jgi:ribosomal protein S18 acetylase RimI-like enzyme
MLTKFNLLFPPIPWIMIKIRNITKEDLEPLAQLNAKIFKDTSKEHARWVFEHSLKNGIPGASLIAMEGDEIVGAIFAEEKMTFYSNSANIKSIFVREEFRGKGIGESLIEKCLLALGRAGMKNVSLSVDPKNEAAVSLYEKYGFEAYRVQYLKRI